MGMLISGSILMMWLLSLTYILIPKRERGEREREFNKLAIFPIQTPPTLPKLILVRSLYAAFTVSESLVDESFL